MKPKTTELLKFKRLSRRLNESVRGTVGLLEMLWVGTAKNAPGGDIGRFSNEEIAVMCDWEGDPDALVDALVETRWLDRCETHRLLVHDWPEHAPDYVRGNLKRWGRDFAIATCPSSVPSTMPSNVPGDGTSSPILALPREEIDRLGDRPTEFAYEPTEVGAEDWQAAVPDFHGVIDDLGKPKMLPDDRVDVIRGVLLARRVLARDRFDDIRKRIRRKHRRGAIERPFGYLQTCLINECKKIGVDFHRARDAITVPDEFLRRNGKAQPP